MMTLPEIHTEIRRFEGDSRIYQPDGFTLRCMAREFIEFYILDYFSDQEPEMNVIELKQKVSSLSAKLDDIDELQFAETRIKITKKLLRGKELTRLFKNMNISEDRKTLNYAGYDYADQFLNGVLLRQPLPEGALPTDPDMVFYQQTPARIILELAAHHPWSKEDRFYDIGSGLGHVPVLLHLLQEVKTTGVEIDPAYCDYARHCAAELGLHEVIFQCADARQTDMRDGTVFFMYTPFRGNMHQQVLEKLRETAQNHPISLYTYGPCTFETDAAPWLRRITPGNCDEFTLTEFQSI